METRGSYRFRREEHLKGKKEIKEVFSKGKRYSRRGARLFVLKNDLPYNRICFSLGKGFKRSVARNRAKRLGREAYRLMKSRLSASPGSRSGHDLILLVFPAPVASMPGPVLSDRTMQLESLFKEAGILE